MFKPSRFEYTANAIDLLYDVVDSADYLDKDKDMIYEALKRKLDHPGFGDYLKRYIWKAADYDSSVDYNSITIKDYQSIIRYAFDRSGTPCSFTPTTAKLSALSKNWLTQKTVKRKVVFLLGFGFFLDTDEVNDFLRKGLKEGGINFKDPFEVICWYCFENHYRFAKYKVLWEQYEALKPESSSIEQLSDEETVNVRNTALGITDDASLMQFLAKLKVDSRETTQSVTARNHFMKLYRSATEVIAEFYNSIEDDGFDFMLNEEKDRIDSSGLVSGQERQRRIERLEAGKRVITAETITPADFENVLCSPVPRDRHGNLTPAKQSALYELFEGKRFSRQHITEILNGSAEISRFDLITLNFIVWSAKTDMRREDRFIGFVDSTNAVLNECFMEKLYAPNPYESYILMCILSEDPLTTYTDVWELSYEPVNN